VVLSLLPPKNSSDNGDVLIAFAGCADDDVQWILEAMQNGGTIRMGNNSLALLLAWAPCKSRCSMGLCTH
jgi:hypothetical protein